MLVVLQLTARVAAVVVMLEPLVLNIMLPHSFIEMVERLDIIIL